MKNFIPTIVLLTFLSIFFCSCSQLQKKSDDISLSELRESNNSCEYLNAFFTLYDAVYEIYLNDKEKKCIVRERITSNTSGILQFASEWWGFK